MTGPNPVEKGLESRIFESFFQRRPRKAPLSAFCIVNAASDVLDG